MREPSALLIPPRSGPVLRPPRPTCGLRSPSTPRGGETHLKLHRQSTMGGMEVERRISMGDMASTMDSFKTQAMLKVGGSEFVIHRLDALGPRAARLPFSLKVLLENLIRREDGRQVTRD